MSTMAKTRTAWRIGILAWLVTSSASCLLQAWIVLAVLLGMVVLLCVWIGAEARHYQSKLGGLLRRDLGFAHGSPYLRNTRGMVEVLTIESVAPGGLFDQAGFQKDDIVVDDVSISEFYKLLERARGGEPVAITVVSWSDKQPLKDRPRRQIVVRVPSQSERARS